MALQVVLLAENRNPEPLEWVATIKGSVPLPVKLEALLPLVEHIHARREGWIQAYQALITILSLPRLSEMIPELDLSPVVTPFEGDVKEFESFLKGYRDFVRNHKLLLRDEQQEIPPAIPRMRMTKGPNQQVTLASSVEEAKMLINNKTLCKSLELYCTNTGNSELYNYMVELSKEPVDHIDTQLGKLTLVPDSLNKHRLVAIVDYWTNVLLSPLEEMVRTILRERFKRCDYLRDHSLGAARVQNHLGPSWSLDLSEWTNRFPILLQQPVVERLLGGNCGQH